MTRRKRWFLAVAATILIGLGYLGYSLSLHNQADYLTVSELKSQGQTVASRETRVGGKVVSGSINWDGEARVIRFLLSDDRESLAIVYQGIAPDNFKPGADLVVEGKYRQDGVFEAQSFGRPRSLCNLCH